MVTQRFHTTPGAHPNKYLHFVIQSLFVFVVVVFCLFIINGFSFSVIFHILYCTVYGLSVVTVKEI